MAKKIDLTGKKYGKLTVIKETLERSNGHALWKCQCECGNIVEVRGDRLRRKDRNDLGGGGIVRSCGCLKNKQDMKVVANTTCTENTMLSKLNSQLQTNNTSGVCGVSWNKATGKWIAQIGFKRNKIHLGEFKNKQDAINARIEAEEKYFDPILEKYSKHSVS